MKKNYILGKFDNPFDAKASLKALKEDGIKVHDVYGPFPIHGAEPYIGIKRSRLTIAAFLFGMTGTLAALSMQIFMLGVDWPMNIGGKPAIAMPSFIPITFELTVLFSALGMVGTFFFVSKLFPGKSVELMDERVTDDVFVIAVDSSSNAAKVEAIFKNNGGIEVTRKDF